MIAQDQYNEFFHDFLVESTELLQEYERNLLEIEPIVNNPSFTFEDIEDSLQAIFRDVHTIKGLAGMMDFHDIKNYTHEAEDILDQIRAKQIVCDGKGVNVMFDILDTLKKLIQNVVAPDSESIILEKELAKLQNFPETSASQEIFEETPGEQSTDIFIQKKIQTEKSLTASNTIRVDTGRLDNLLNTVGELVIGKNRLIDISKSLTRQRSRGYINNGPNRLVSKLAVKNASKSDLEETVDEVTQLIINLQETAMKLRMVPIGYTFRKFHRLVRDLAKKNGKKIQFEIEGEANEVDRTVIESMEDPLLHMIRNAIDHGIEETEERIQKGKDVTGKLKLAAFQENNMIVIHIKDDGRGIDTEKIHSKAVNKGFAGSAAQLSKREILNLVFLPGFSTSEEVTDVSGRGVGMDVVKKNILKLNGLIDIESEVGKGTTIIIKLPLTLAIIQVLMIEVDKSRYCIPITNVFEILEVSISEIQYINGYETVQIRDSILPMIRLNKIFGKGLSKDKDEKEELFIVVVGIAEKRVGFVVDELNDQQDIIIKPLGSYLEGIQGVSGATILGDGEISLVLDVASIWQREVAKMEKYEITI